MRKLQIFLKWLNLQTHDISDFKTSMFVLETNTRIKFTLFTTVRDYILYCDHEVAFLKIFLSIIGSVKPLHYSLETN